MSFRSDLSDDDEWFKKTSAGIQKSHISLVFGDIWDIFHINIGHYGLYLKCIFICEGLTSKAVEDTFTVAEEEEKEDAK